MRYLGILTLGVLLVWMGSADTEQALDARIQELEKVVYEELRPQLATLQQELARLRQMHQELLNALRQQTGQQPNFPVPRALQGESNLVALRLPDNLPSMGSPDAPLLMVEFSDFQCPFCGRFFRNTLDYIKARYVKTGKVRFYYWHLPLTSIHPRAVPAAIAAECARRQNRFWEMHDLIFQNQNMMRDEDFYRYAQMIGLDMQAFEACYQGDDARKVVEQQMNFALQQLRIRSTPTFLIGVLTPDGMFVATRFSGAHPFARFQQILDRILARIE